MILRNKIILFGLPGAFTATCSKFHLPGYVKNAQQILDKFESEGLTQDLEQAADFIYAKTRETLDILKNEDLLSQTEYDNLLNNEYQNYVPLTGFDQLDVDRSKQTNMGEGGKTLPIRGKEIKTATGRKTKAASPLANIMKARERAIMRGGKNNVLVNLLDMLILLMIFVTNQKL